MKIDFGFLIIIFGLIGNIITILVFMKKKLKSISARNILCALALADSLKLLSLILFFYSDFGFKFISEFCCRLQKCTEVFTTALSVFLITFSAIEKFISIKYSKCKFNRNSAILIIVGFSLIYSFLFAILTEADFKIEISKNTTTNNSLSKICTAPFISILIELVFSQLIPFLTTFLFSCATR